MKTVMLIDDDPTMLRLLQTLIEIEGFRPVSWDGKQDILTDIEQKNPDLILLDVNLRGLNGIDILKKVRSSNKIGNLPILMTSGMDYTEACMRAGATAFFLKPYMPDKLLQTIRMHLDNKA